jgi:hypothetical protein
MARPYSYDVRQKAVEAFLNGAKLGRVDLLFKPEEGTDKVEKAQEVSGQFVKTRKYMSVLL